MSRPSKEELETALAAAGEIREQGTDKFFIAKSLLNHHYRLQALEKVMEKAKLYLHSGQNAKAEWDLEKAIEAAEEASKDIHSDDEDIHPW